MPAPTPSRPMPRVIVFSLFVYRCLLNLWPASFRRDYADLAQQDFRRCCYDAYQKRGALGVLCQWPLLLGETVIGMFAEYASELFGRRQPMQPTLRRSMVIAFCAFMLFVFAYIALVRTVDPAAPFQAVGHMHPELALTYTLTTYSSVFAFLVVVLSGMPVLLLALWRASRTRLRGVLRLFVLRPRQLGMLLGIALGIAVVFLTYLLGSQLFFSPTPCATSGSCLFNQAPLIVVGDLLLLLAVTTACVFVVLCIVCSLSLAVLRTEFDLRVLRFSLVPIAALAAAMGIATLAVAIWIVRLWTVAPQFAASSAGLGSGQTAWVIAIVLAMALSTLAAASAFRSGLHSMRLAV